LIRRSARGQKGKVQSHIPHPSSSRVNPWGTNFKEGKKLEQNKLSLASVKETSQKKGQTRNRSTYRLGTENPEDSGIRRTLTDPNKRSGPRAGNEIFMWGTKPSSAQSTDQDSALLEPRE